MSSLEELLGLFESPIACLIFHLFASSKSPLSFEDETRSVTITQAVLGPECRERQRTLLKVKAGGQKEIVIW